MNAFLKNLDITFRRDPTNYRPRINKMNSLKDQEQKSAGAWALRSRAELCTRVHPASARMLCACKGDMHSTHTMHVRLTQHMNVYAGADTVQSFKP